MCLEWNPLYIFASDPPQAHTLHLQTFILNVLCIPIEVYENDME